jgi:hypothetical protein
MPLNVIKSFAKKLNKSVKEIEKEWNIAVKEAKSMGMEDNHSYIMSIFKNLLGIKESIEIDEFVKRFLESGECFDSFYETLTAGNLESGDIPDTLKYVHRKQDDDEEEDEEGNKYKIVKMSPEGKKKLENPNK